MFGFPSIHITLNLGRLSDWTHRIVELEFVVICLVLSDVHIFELSETLVDGIVVHFPLHVELSLSVHLHVKHKLSQISYTTKLWQDLAQICHVFVRWLVKFFIKIIIIIKKRGCWLLAFRNKIQTLKQLTRTLILTCQHKCTGVVLLNLAHVLSYENQHLCCPMKLSTCVVLLKISTCPMKLSTCVVLLRISTCLVLLNSTCVLSY